MYPLPLHIKECPGLTEPLLLAEEKNEKKYFERSARFCLISITVILFSVSRPHYLLQVVWPGLASVKYLLLYGDAAPGIFPASESFPRHRVLQ